MNVYHRGVMLLANNNLISMCLVTNVRGVFSDRVLPSTCGGQLKTMVTIYWFRVTSSLNEQILMELFQGYISSYLKWSFLQLIIKTVITIITIVVTIFFSAIIIHKIENQLSTEQMNPHIQRNSVSDGKIKVTSLSLYVSKKRTYPKNKNKYTNLQRSYSSNFRVSLSPYIYVQFPNSLTSHSFTYEPIGCLFYNPIVLPLNVKILSQTQIQASATSIINIKIHIT